MIFTTANFILFAYAWPDQIILPAIGFAMCGIGFYSYITDPTEV